jgi:hypothetical protein
MFIYIFKIILFSYYIYIASLYNNNNNIYNDFKINDYTLLCRSFALNKLIY